MEHIDYQFSHVHKLVQERRWGTISQWAYSELFVVQDKPELLISLVTALFPIRSRVCYNTIFSFASNMLKGMGHDPVKILKGLEP
jgi:hypothetical protein